MLLLNPGYTRTVNLAANQTLYVETLGLAVVTVVSGLGITAGVLASVDGSQTFGPYAEDGVLTIAATKSDCTYGVSDADNVARFITNPLPGGLALVGPDGVKNAMFQPSRLYKFFIPGQQFIGSGDAKDKSGNSADAVRMASLTDAAAWANPGYFTTGAGANLGISVPSAKVQFNLETQSVIFSCRVKKAAPVGAESIFGCGDGASAQGFYISMRAASGSVSKVRPILNTTGGVVSGLADSLATFGEAAATDHVLTLAIDGITKGVFLYCDGTLSNSYPAAFTGGTTVANNFAFGINAGGTGTTFSGQFSGAHLLAMTGGLPTNISVVAQKLAAAPHMYLTDSDLVF